MDDSTTGSGETSQQTAESSYAVTMEPMGAVEFEAVPESWVAYKTGYGDMGVALGIGDGVVGVDRPHESFRLLKERFYSQLPGFELDLDDTTNIRADGIALMNGGSDPAKGVFYAMDPTAAGYEMKQYRDLGIRNAFDGVETGEFGRTDYETLLEVDPEIVVFHWGVTYEKDAFESRFVEPLVNHEVGKELTAVKEGNLYPGGTAEQGPVINLFQTEMLAQQQYPEQFGQYPGLGEIPDRTLFDCQRVADIVTGEL
ncbi:substrate-binding protein [Halogranum amylolyticum]|uniref:Substrate-binding protein n=1 Tax=Halogranum amylolyticum TaxID=660520 RepID=A0A1H8P5X3_9EURY|nr:ABC transporter substrate-binding protein [Halogranum amylolyticum]SEO37340.1 substrate-binding protein [Halogranum amylolyticum]